MHVRYSIVRGMPVVDEQTQQQLGAIQGILLQPDTGAVVGFYVTGAMNGETLFLAAADILSWGTRVHVRDADRLAPPEDLVRIAPLLESPRTILGQPIVTQRHKRKLGTCADVQFDTRHFRLEWLFPRFLYFFERRPVPASDILEVTPAAIIVREPLRPKGITEELSEAPAALLNEVVPSTTATRSL